LRNVLSVKKGVVVRAAKGGKSASMVVNLDNDGTTRTYVVDFPSTTLPA
jgi:hypothetical protein